MSIVGSFPDSARWGPTYRPSIGTLDRKDGPMDTMDETTRAIPVPTSPRRRTILAALVIGSLLIGGAVGRATSGAHPTIAQTTRFTTGGAVGGHPVFAHRYAGARPDGTEPH